MLERRMIGEPLKYNGHTIIVRHLGPDLLCEVDGSESGSFFMSAEGARKAGMKYCDLMDKEKEKSSN